MAELVQYNIKNGHYASVSLSASGVPTFGASYAIPGWVSIALPAIGDPVEDYADGVKYFTMPVNDGYDGTAAFKNNKPEEGLAHLERAHKLNPWSFQVINNYASALLSLKKNHEAIPLLEKAVEINPRYDEGKFNLSYAWTQLGDLQKAESWLDKVDTIPNPTTLDERQKNEKTLKNLSVFRAEIAKMQNKQASPPN